MFKNEFVNFNNTLYIIKKLLKESDLPIIDTWKEHLRADTVLKKRWYSILLRDCT